jgi:hypothetical protein
MPEGSVKITDPAGRAVYINGDYRPDFPKNIPCTFAVQYGNNIFETLTAGNRVDYRLSVTTDDGNQNCQVALVRVQP